MTIGKEIVRAVAFSVAIAALAAADASLQLRIFDSSVLRCAPSAG
jgi:hypothetical protein